MQIAHSPTRGRLVRVALTVLGSATLASTERFAQCERFQLTASGLSSFDEFGVSVSIRGTTALVGAWGDDDKGGAAGAAYLFDATSGVQIAKLLASDGASSDVFGQSVAVGDAVAVIGAPGDDDLGSGSGSVYLFDATSGVQIAKLQADDAAALDSFGESVAIGGNTLIVGAPGDDDRGSASGSAYLFDATSGQELFKLLASDGASTDALGQAVGISGSVAIVGAPASSKLGTLSGRAYLFDVLTGQQTAALEGDDTTAQDRFGAAVAVEGANALVGVPEDDDNGTSSGSAYLFDVATGQQRFKLLPDDGAAFERFGYSVALSGTTAVVGAVLSSAQGTDSGAAYFFDVTTGLQTGKAVLNSGAASDYFGAAVATDGTLAVVGAIFADISGMDAGSATVFRTDCVLVSDFSAGVTTGDFPLAVEFDDLSLGSPPITSWAWDFGDGGASSEASPSHLYSLPGTYDVSLIVQNDIDSDSRTQTDFIVVLPSGPASVTLENGSGSNPLIFTSVSLPVLGATWTTHVDGAAIGSNTGLTFVFGYSLALDPGLPLSVGELLIDLSSPFAVLNFSTLIAGSSTHNQAVPNDLALAGVSIATQAFVNKTPNGKGQLTNALLLVLGTF